MAAERLPMRPSGHVAPCGAAGMGSTRHVAADESGELACLDTFYMGNLKGVGKVWQITACDAASSYGVAAIPPELTPEAAAAFLRDPLVPLFRKATWPTRRVLIDGANGFRCSFAEHVSGD